MWAHTLLQQLVTITTSDGRQWTGIIGGPQTHAISPEARKKVVAMEELFIDLGVDSRESIQEMSIEVGDVREFSEYLPNDWFESGIYDWESSR